MGQRLEPTRQASIQAWADAQRKALHEALKNTPVNPIVAQTTTEAAAASGGAGGQAGGVSILNMPQVLENLSNNFQFITNLIPNSIRFYDDTDDSSPVNTNQIGDGFSDMYDGANYFNTNRTQSWSDIITDDANYNLNIPYTHTQHYADVHNVTVQYNYPTIDGVIADGENYFGPGSKYFTNMYPGLFLLVADAISIEEFTIGGNIGSDGNGIDVGIVDPVTGYEWTMFFKSNLDATDEDPSINHIILVPGTTEGKNQLIDTSGRYDDHGVFGLAGTNAVIAAVVATAPGEAALNQSQALAIANMILNVVYGNLPVVPPSAGSIIFNGKDPDSGGSYVAAPYGQITQWLPGAADFTVEWYMYKTADGHPRIFSIGPDTGANFGVSIEGSGLNMALYAWIGNGNHNWVIQNVDNGWHHFALVRTGGYMTLYKDGTSVGYSAADTTNINATGGLDLYIGTDGVTDGDTFKGNITNFRWTNSAVYTGDFTPSATPLTVLAQTKLLLLGGSIYNPVVDSTGINNLDYNNLEWSSGTPFV